MKNDSDETSADDVDFFLDITNDVCPLTFVKTKLLIEKMAQGQIAEVRLKGKEPLENVPRSVRDHGHEVMALAPEDPAAPADAVHRLRVRKAQD